MTFSTPSQAAGLRKKISENLENIRETIHTSAQKTGRDPSRIQIVAVTKSVELDVIRTLLELGQIDLAENRVQQLLQRASILQEQMTRRTILEHEQNTPVSSPRWHMIGHLQRNKVKAIIPLVTLIHSVDTLRLAEEVSHFGQKLNKSQDVLIEVNTSGEDQKYGLPVAAAGHVIEQIKGMNNIRVCGLMTMAPIVSEPELARPYFERLYELFLEIKVDYRLGSEFCHLSMGMSQDYGVAVECGATIVRVGTALFEGIQGAED